MGRFSIAAQLIPDRNVRVVPSAGEPVEVQVMGRGSLEVLRARNVSRTGIGVYVPHGFSPCDLDGEVELVVTLPGERPFLARGQIRHWTDGAGEGQHFGLHFTHMTRAHRALVKQYVRRLLKTD